MPTDVHFIGAEDPIRVEEDYDAVKSALHGSDSQFNRLTGMTENRHRVTIYKTAVAYIAEAPELDPMLADTPAP